MNVIRCDTPHDFLERAEAFLLADEACHNLLLGRPAASMAQKTMTATSAYFAVVANADDVVVAAMMVPPHRLVLSRTEWPQTLALIAHDLLGTGIMPPGVHGPVPVGEQFARVWQQLSGQRYEPGLAQRLYRITRVRPLPGAPGHLRPATQADRQLLIGWMRAFHVEAFGQHAPPVDVEQIVDERLQGTTEGLYLWEHGRPRAFVGHAGATPHGVRVGPVYTPPEYRHQGYGGVAVATLSQLLLDRGYQFCCLFADLANLTSNRIYQRIGYEPVCDVCEYRFLPVQ